MVVEVLPEDVEGESPLRMMRFQQEIEQRFYEDAGFTFTGRENRSGKLAEREMTLQA